MTDFTRENNGFQKKSICVFSVEMKEGTENNEFAAASDNHLLGLLPPDAIITDAMVFVKTVSDAATSCVATLGTASGGAQILSGADLTTAGEQGTFVPDVETGTGDDLWLGLTYTGAATNVGVYVVVVEYIEYLLNTGDFTRFSGQ